MIEIWNLEKAGPKFVKIPLTERGHFYSGDCYLVLYTYYDEKDYYLQKYIAYFWQGRDAHDKYSLVLSLSLSGYNYNIYIF